MRKICKWFQNGNCKYGSRCKYEHIKSTPLLDPPRWIFSKCDNLNLTEISSDEVRYSLMIKDTRHILDDIWIDNYTEMYKELNRTCKECSIESTSDRSIDIRRNPEYFMVPFDPENVEKAILNLRSDDPVVDNVIPSTFKDNVMSEKDNLDVSPDSYTPSFVKEFTDKKRGSYGHKEEVVATRNSGMHDAYPRSEIRYERDQKNYRNDQSYVNRQYDDNNFYNKGNRYNSYEKNRFNDTKAFNKHDNYPNRQDNFSQKYNNRQGSYNNRQDYYNNSHNSSRGFIDRNDNFNSRKDNYNNSYRHDKDFDRSGYRTDKYSKSYSDRNENSSFDRELRDRGAQEKFFDKKSYKNESSRDFLKKEDTELSEEDFGFKNVPYDYKKR